MRTDSASAPKTVYLKDYTPAPYKVAHISLTFQLFEDKTIVKSEVNYVKNPASTSNDLVLNGQDQKIISVALNGEALTAYEYADDKMTIKDAGEQFTLSITTEIHPETNTALEGLYKSQGNYCTQCEAEGFRRITFYQDRPDVLSTFSVRI